MNLSKKDLETIVDSLRRNRTSVEMYHEPEYKELVDGLQGVALDENVHRVVLLDVAHMGSLIDFTMWAIDECPDWDTDELESRREVLKELVALFNEVKDGPQ